MQPFAQLTPKHARPSGACLHTLAARVAGQHEGVKAQFGRRSISFIYGYLGQIRAHTSLEGPNRHTSSTEAIVEYATWTNLELWRWKWILAVDILDIMTEIQLTSVFRFGDRGHKNSWNKAQTFTR